MITQQLTEIRPRYVLHLDITREELDDKKIEDILKHHDFNRLKYMKLQDYYEGRHDILHRTKDEGKNNNKLINNFASYITDVVTGYFVGKAIAYTSDNEEYMSLLQGILDSNDEADENAKLVKYCAIKKHAFEILYTDEDGNVSFAAEEPENMIMIYDTKVTPEPIFAIRRYKPDTLDIETDEETIEIYDSEKITRYRYYRGMLTFLDEQEHFFGDVPVIEYKANDERLGLFERQKSLIDAYNKAQSDTMNDIEYFSDAYLALVGMGATEPEDVKKLRENKIILLDENGQAYFITKPVDDAYLEHYKDRIKDDIHRFSMVPNLTDEAFSGTASGVALRYKLWGLEQIASSLERKFRKSIQRRIRLITNILNVRGNYDYRDIELHFTRNIPVNIKEEAETLGLLDGRISRDSAYALMSFIEDPQAERQAFEEEKESNMSRFNLDLDLDEEEEQETGDVDESAEDS